MDLYYDFLTTNNDNEEAGLNHHREGHQNGVEPPAQLKQQIMGNVGNTIDMLTGTYAN